MKSIEIRGVRTLALENFIKEWESIAPGIVAHTSGSTGEPKMILLRRQDMINSAVVTCRYFGIDSHSILGLPLSAAYIAGKMMAVRAMVAGATLYVEEPSNRPLEEWKGGEVSLLSVVPSQIPYLLESGRLRCVKRLLIGGAPLPQHIEDALLEAGYKEAYVSYGMTETCSHVAIRWIGSDLYEALPGTYFSTDERECLRIYTERASYSPVQTNDVVERIDLTHFRWLGRWDNVVMSGGVKLMPEMIERKLSTMMGETPYVIYGRRSEKWGEELVMMVEASQPVEGLVERLRGVLAPYEVPKEIITVAALERVNGKIKRPRTV